ncbi:MAG: DUF72 domain-containing protein [Elusimicrobia bacterium]|nr:DUF72 domain-containing protein [Candidatus Obscuribacterium magneticum]
MIKIGCADFPVATARFQRKLPVVELDALFEKFPMTRTVEKWRAQAPPDFEFVVCASHHITHPGRFLDQKNPSSRSHQIRAHRFGYFQDTPEVRRAFLKTRHIAELLSSRIVLFELPKSFAPHSDNIGHLQRFFKAAERGLLNFVWDPPASWPLHLTDQISKSLNLVQAFNPLRPGPKPAGSLRYYRLGDRERTRGNYRFSTDELEQIKRACDLPLSYVIFNSGPLAFQEAVRFSKLL